MRLTCETAGECQQIGEAMQQWIVPAVEVSMKLLLVTIVLTLLWHAYSNRREQSQQT